MTPTYALTIIKEGGNFAAGTWEECDYHVIINRVVMGNVVSLFGGRMKIRDWNMGLNTGIYDGLGYLPLIGWVDKYD